MAEENDSASKTEEPSARKLEQAREKGDVVKTPDLGPLASLAAAAAVMALGGGWMSRNLAFDLLPFLSHPQEMQLEGVGGVGVARMAFMAAAPIMAAVLLAAAAAGAAGNLLQTGLIFSPEKLKADFKKVSPIEGFKRLFGPDGLMQFVKSVIKVFLTGCIGWWVMKPFLPQLATLSALEPAAMMPFAADILRRLVFATAAFLLVVAGADWMWHRHRFMSRMKMTKEEMKEEYRQSEGDPHIKARLKQMRIERAKRRMMQAVPGATVVIMNPTHYAVALKYEPGENPAPLCVAKGLDNVALKIRAVAEAAGVPVIEDPPLARALYASVDLDDIIPPAHYEAVAKVIGFVLNGARRAVTRTL